jgi:hypothetical protein
VWGCLALFGIASAIPSYVPVLLGLVLLVAVVTVLATANRLARSIGADQLAKRAHYSFATIALTGAALSLARSQHGISASLVALVSALALVGGVIACIVLLGELVVALRTQLAEPPRAVVHEE